MKQKDKELLLKDLCGRLPYKVKIQRYNGELLDDVIESIDNEEYTIINGDCYIEDIKPYLFPLSSMTEDQSNEIRSYNNSIEGKLVGMQGRSVYLIDWLNEHHFDYRGLIEKGLAIDATNLNIY